MSRHFLCRHFATHEQRISFFIARSFPCHHSLRLRPFLVFLIHTPVLPSPNPAAYSPSLSRVFFPSCFFAFRNFFPLCHPHKASFIFLWACFSSNRPCTARRSVKCHIRETRCAVASLSRSSFACAAILHDFIAHAVRLANKNSPMRGWKEIRKSRAAGGKLSAALTRSTISDKNYAEGANRYRGKRAFLLRFKIRWREDERKSGKIKPLLGNSATLSIKNLKKKLRTVLIDNREVACFSSQKIKDWCFL